MSPRSKELFAAADVPRRVTADNKLNMALAELRKAHQEAKEAAKLRKAAPLTDEERAKQTRIFGTQEDRAIFARLAEVASTIKEQPEPAEAMRRIPPSLHHAVDTQAFRAAAAWLISFSDIWDQESRGRRLLEDEHGQRTDVGRVD